VYKAYILLLQIVFSSARQRWRKTFICDSKILYYPRKSL